MQKENNTAEEKKGITKVDVAAEELRLALRKVTCTLDEHDAIKQRLDYLHAICKKSEVLHTENEFLKKQLADSNATNVSLKDQAVKKK